ncbi:MAG: carbohydrate porin, partial [Candidatus Tectomicrobia bacterium]
FPLLPNQQIHAIQLWGSRYQFVKSDGSGLVWIQQVEGTGNIAGTIHARRRPGSLFIWASLSLLVTAPPPNQGQGAAVGAWLANQVYTVAGFADTNGDPTRIGFDTFIDEAEFFTHIELGWSPSFERRYLDNVYVTAWHADEREKAGVPDGWGLLFSAQRFLKERWLPFLRAGYSEGEAPALNASVSMGLGYYVRERADVTALGVSWGKPSLDGLRDQYTVEYFYRLQLSPNFALTPDVQLILDPALNPNEDVIAVFGLRARLAL